MRATIIKTARSEKVARDIAEFLSRGGVITVEQSCTFSGDPWRPQKAIHKASAIRRLGVLK